MAGTYIEGISKVLSGVYTLIKSVISTITRGERGIAAYSFTSDWGPENELTVSVQSNEFKALYNADKTALTAGKVYKHAYKGNPYKVLGYRMVTAAGAKGSCILNDAGAAMSLTLQTLYKSARAFKAVVKAGTVGTIVQIIEAGVILVEVEDTTLSGLEAKLNASDYVRVSAKGANLPAVTAGTDFAGGNNGDVSTATEYAAFLDSLEADGTANSFTLDAVTDETILTTAETFVKRVRGEGFYVTFVRGGGGAWDNDGGTAANTKSKAVNYRGVVNVGNGCDGYTAAEMALFIAARVAAVGLNRTLTDEPVPYTAINKKLKPSQRIACKEAGTLVFVQVGDNILIDEGVNTLTTPVLEGETAEFGKIRISNALDYTSKDLEAFGDAYKRDKSNTQEAREIYASIVEKEYLGPLAALEIIKLGFFYRPDPDWHGKDAIFTPKIDEAYFFADITPVDSMERIYQKIGVNF